MTSYSHLCHWIKLIHCGTQTMYWVIKLWVVVDGFYFILYQSSNCHKLCIQRQMVVRWKRVSYLLYGKYRKKFFYSLLTLTLHWIKFETLAMQLKRQPVEAWKNEKHYSKDNNTSQNPTPRWELSPALVSGISLISQISRPCEVWRSGHNISCLRSFLAELSSCRVTYENCNKSSGVFYLAWGEWMDLRNSSGTEFRTFTLQPYRSFFSKIFTRSGKMHHVGLNSCTSKSRKWQVLLYVWRYWLTRVT